MDCSLLQWKQNYVNWISSSRNLSEWEVKIGMGNYTFEEKVTINGGTWIIICLKWKKATNINWNHKKYAKPISLATKHKLI